MTAFWEAIQRPGGVVGRGPPALVCRSASASDQRLCRTGDASVVRRYVRARTRSGIQDRRDRVRCPVSGCKNAALASGLPVTAAVVHRRSAGTYHHQTYRCDCPAVSHMHLRIGPVALSRHPTDRLDLLPGSRILRGRGRSWPHNVSKIKRGQFVVGSFATSDNTCVICQHGYQSSCVQREFMTSAQAPYLRVPLADGTLVATNDVPIKN